MYARSSKQRLYASLMILGAGILLFRTIRMIAVEHAFDVLVLWVFALLVAELLIDLGCILSSLRWLVTNSRANASSPLRLGAAVTILHAIRVLIYVLGRTGPWVNFDVKPEYRDSYTFEWFWVYFAVVLSILGVVGVIVIWKIMRHRESAEYSERRG